ncbi:MAG: hypothetical protein ACLTTW_05565 [Coprobacter sp.]
MTSSNRMQMYTNELGRCLFSESEAALRYGIGSKSAEGYYYEGIKPLSHNTD